jgi:CubicO group peptidase (beta-lactamase class C family)
VRERRTLPRRSDPRAAPPLAPPELPDGVDVAAPESVGLRRDVLESLLDGARADLDRDLRSVLVARQDRLVFEAYFNGSDRETLHDIRSAAKSITGTLVGLALDEERIPNLETPFLNFFQQYAPETAATSGKRKVSIRHLLEMTSGFDVPGRWIGEATLPRIELPLIGRRAMASFTRVMATTGGPAPNTSARERFRSTLRPATAVSGCS